MSEPNTVVGKILLIFVFSAQKYKIVSWSMVVAFVVCPTKSKSRQEANGNRQIEFKTRVWWREEIPDPSRRSLKRAQRDDSRLETRHDDNNNKTAISKYLV